MSAKPVLYHRVPAGRYAEAFALQPLDRPPPGPGIQLYYDEAGMALTHGGERRLFRLRLDRVRARAAQSLLLARAAGPASARASPTCSPVGGSMA